MALHTVTGIITCVLVGVLQVPSVAFLQRFASGACKHVNTSVLFYKRSETPLTCNPQYMIILLLVFIVQFSVSCACLALNQEQQVSDTPPAPFFTALPGNMGENRVGEWVEYRTISSYPACIGSRRS